MRVLTKYIIVLNVLLLASGTYLLADLASLMIGQRLEINPMLPPVESLVTVPGQVRPTQEVYQAILDRNIFGSHPVSSIAPAETVPEVELEPLRIRLVGTVAGVSRDSFAVIYDETTKEENLYRLGDPVGVDGSLLEIQRNEVTVLRMGGVKETFQVNWIEKSKRSIAKPGKRKKKSSRSSSDQTSWVLDREEVRNALENLPKLLTQARVIPHLTSDGQNEGFRIVAIKNDSFYQKIGLQNGDIIQQINGVEIKDPQTFMSVFSQLKNESSISLDLLRSNQKETFSYEIR